ncbi:ribokinase [Curvivirga aplysinae]|uniref:ribokinase n=1 Tax=Curvivirga aplysinae TaxID=2529852 RepID=UPI001C3FE2E6|nr:ribokinase [Curvivirga aplysinae]
MIITFGSINLDITFPLDHMPKPGETVLGKTFLMNPGGKGANQALAAACAGADTAMVGMVGDDGFAEEALCLLKEYEVDLSQLGKSDLPTGCASIWVDQGAENSIAVASGANLSAKSTQVPDSWLTPDNRLLIQMETPIEENWKLIRRAHEKGCPVTLNVAPARYVPLDILKMIDLLIVNEGEARTIADGLDIDSEKVTRLPRYLAEKFGMKSVLTMGGAGSIFFSPDGGISTPALPIAPIDTTAAGDTFVGYLGAMLVAGKDMEEALRYASVGAGLCCMKAGSQSSVPIIEDVEAKLSSLPASKVIK